ncbi:MAG: hypothetical protein AB8H79_09780 [Myxococcota bacterium]
MNTPSVSRLIPLITAVGAVLPACSEPVLGQWEVTRLKSKVLPKSNTYSDGTIGTKTAQLNFEADGDAEFIKTSETTKTDGTVLETKAYRYLGSWTAEGGRTYEIKLPEWDDNALDCSIQDDELECDDAVTGERIFDAVPAE